MWAVAGGAGFLALGLYDGIKTFSNYRYAKRLDAAIQNDLSKEEGKTSYVVVEVQSEKAKKIYGSIVVPITMKNEEFYLNPHLPSESMIVTMDPKQLALQTHRTVEKYSARADADALAVASIGCAIRAQQLWQQYVYYNEQLTWGPGLRDLAATPPRMKQGVACVAGSIVLGYAAVKQFEKYWKLPN